MADERELRIDLGGRKRDLHSRIEADLAVAQSLVNGTDEDSLDGRRARMVLRSFQRALEDLGSDP